MCFAACCPRTRDQHKSSTMQFVTQLCVLRKYAPLPLCGGIGLLVPRCLIGLCYIAQGGRQWAVCANFREGLRPSQSLVFSLSLSLPFSLSICLCLSLSLFLCFSLSLLKTGKRWAVEVTTTWNQIWQNN